MALLGLDIGTSGCKATVIDFSGNIKGAAYVEYALSSPREGWHEIDPDKVWTSVCQVIRQAISAYSGEPIRAISASSFGEAVIAVDRCGNVLHPSILYIDSRGRDESAYLEKNLGRNKILQITGAAPHPMYSICKIMWIMKHKPEIYRQTWKFMFFADFILYRLGAHPHIDYSLAARSMAFDITRKDWSPEILDCAGFDQAKWPEAVQAGTLVGNLSPGIAVMLGLPADVRLAAGGHDQPCAALGSGAIQPGMAVDGIGTTECITPSYDHPIISESMARYGFACVPHVVKGQYVTYAFSITSGSLLKWYINNFGEAFRLEAQRQNTSKYELLIAAAGCDPASLFVVPHFAGSATPYMDADAKGAMIGLTINTSPAEIIRAILEGITFEIMVNQEKLAEIGISVDEIRAVGGLAQSSRFLQLKADMMGKTISTLCVSEAGTLGTAILAGTAIGIYPSVNAAVQQVVRKKQDFHPDPGLHAFYQERFEIYKRIYPAIKSIC